MSLFPNLPMVGVNNSIWPNALAPLAGGGRPPFGFLFLMVEGRFLAVDGHILMLEL